MSNDHPEPPVHGNGPWPNPSRHARALAHGRLAVAAAVALGACVAFALGGCALGSYLAYRVAPDYPRDETEEIHLPHLSAPVEVVIDAAGIPHVDAGSEDDLLRAVGWVQARSRFFEMDVLRRFARGRLAEMVGERRFLLGTTIELDRTMRAWGFEAAAIRETAALDPDTRSRMSVFVEGVNAGLARHMPIEHRLLGIEPEPWTIEDSLAVGILTAWGVTHNWHQETTRLLLALHAGIDRAERIYGSAPWEGGTTLDRRPERPSLPPAVAPELREILPGRPPPPRARGEAARPGVEVAVAPMAAGASNAWVVAGARSASGKPILANDPHLMHLLPSVLFQQHLRAPGLDVIGVTVPGLPYVLAGHNARVAWGMTSAVADTMDLYVERPDPADPDSVLAPGGPEKIRREGMVIRARDGGRFDEHRFALRFTRHGPLMQDIYPGLLPAWAPPIALRWDTSGAAGAVREIALANRARTVEEIERALRGVALPVTTWTAADTAGVISTFATGHVPVRPHHLGTFPAPGWIAAYDWTGWLDPAALPRGSNPESGFFAHGNNLMVEPGGAGPYIQIDSAPSYRYDRIAELVQAAGRHSVESLARIQTDVLLLRARRILPRLLEDLTDRSDLGALGSRAVGLLETWDGLAEAGSPAAAVFFVTYREAVVEALADELDERGLQFLLSQRYSTNVADLWFDSPGHPVWDDRRTQAVESRGEVVRTALERAVARLGETQGNDPDGWRWGRLHDLAIRHPFGSAPIVGSFMNLPESEAAGGLDSVWKSHFDLGSPDHPFRAMAGPVFRMVVDLADLDHGLWIIDTGASGWPGSPHYGDQHELWKRGEYLPMVSSWGEVRRDAVAVLRLR